jgi:hypothetical protein
MNKLICVSLLFLMGCGGPTYDSQYFRAISEDKKDTAFLKLQLSSTNFYGDYQVNYNGNEKDDGTISGHVNGDTLIGKYTYLSRDHVKSSSPVAFLKSNENLKLGSGLMGKYLGLQVYKFGTITFKDSLLQFRPVSLEELHFKK